MRIESYIRNKTNQYLRPLLIKDKCEICGEVEGLELHHIKSFAQLLEECLEKLGYKYYKNKNNYTDLELENIINWMLGVQLKIQYITVCKDCHTDIHNEMGGFYSTTDKFEEYCIIENMKKKLNEKRNIKNVVIPYLDNIVGKRLYSNEQKELTSVLDTNLIYTHCVDYRTKKLKPSTLKDMLENTLDLPYKVSKIKTEDRMIDEKGLKRITL